MGSFHPTNGRLPYLIYKPFFAGEDISARRRDHLHGTGSSTPEWEVDVGSIWTPLGGSLAIAGGAGNAHAFGCFILNIAGRIPVSS
ncbi:MAG: hypothetical protein IPK82_23855 [Polyangiaceae bacterium]|nr:hypothetical protein [Polyangiaceae bacterium]